MKIELKPFEIEVSKELEKTLFDSDEVSQKMFHGDFDAYFDARQDDEKYLKIVDNYCKKRIGEGKKQEVIEEEWEEDPLEFEMPMEDFGKKLAGLKPQDSDVYESAFTWGLALYRWMTIQYENPEKQNRDSYRVLCNCIMVAAKLAFAGFMPDKDFESSFDDLSDEVSQMGLKMAKIFLQRTLESLVNLMQNDLFDKNRIMKFLDLGQYIDRQIDGYLNI